ncbi:MAG: NTP transferase domain-containing protein [Bacteroidales bacterium]|nr:NTP transferase domain-containing protein [Bacteroidales bacterium]
MKKAFILAAGLGTRLKPLTDRMPKALVPVGGVPLLEQLFIRLKDAGYDEIVVNVHHFADMIEEFLEQKGNFGLKVSVSDERDLLRETGGAIRHAAPLLGCDSGRFLVHNVDILSDLDLEWFDSRFGECSGQIADLLVTDRETSRYLLFDNTMRLVGWTNVKTGEVRSPYPDLDPAACRRLAFAGIHNVSEAALPLMASWPEKFSIIDFYLSVCDRCLIRGIEAEGVSIFDAGTKVDICTEVQPR